MTGPSLRRELKAAPRAQPITFSAGNAARAAWVAAAGFGVVATFTIVLAAATFIVARGRSPLGQGARA